MTGKKIYGRFNLFRVVNNCISAQFSDKQALPRPPQGVQVDKGPFADTGVLFSTMQLDSHA